MDRIADIVIARRRGHFRSKYRRARREEGLVAQEAVRLAFHSVGQALWVTSLILVAGFLVLSRSSFAMNSDMGLLTAATIVFALLADFLMLPPLLMWLDSTRKAATQASSVETAEDPEPTGA